MNRLSRACALAAVLSLVAVALVGCAPAASLDGTSWQLTEWSVSSIDPADVTITLQFDGGQATGSGGVNGYGASYEVGPGDALAIGEIVSTLMAGPEPAMSAEASYFTLLSQAKSYRIDGQTLRISGADGQESLVFEAVAE